MPEKKFELSVIMKLVNQLTSPLKQIGVGFGRYSTRVKKANKDTKSFGKTLKSLGASMSSLGRKLTLKLTAPIATLQGIMFKTAMSFESAWTGVLKTVNASVPELAKLKTELKGLALEIPLSTKELFGIGEAAGQLGIKVKSISAFTKVMANLGATTDLSAKEAAVSLAQLANITQMPQGQFDRLGSVVSGLGNKLATNEVKIVNMGLRLASAGKLIGLSEAQILGVAGALAALGLESQAGGTSFAELTRTIKREIGTSSEKIWGFAKISGLSIKQFEKLWKEDALGAITKFAKGMSKLEDQNINTIQVLDAFGLQGRRVSDMLLRMAGSGDKFKDTIRDATKFWIENNATTDEAALRYKTAASRIFIFWNHVEQLSESFGQHLLPSVQKVTDFFLPMIKWLRDLSPEIKKNILNVLTFAAAIGPLLVALGAIMTAIAGSTGLIALIGLLSPLIITLGLIAAAFIAIIPAIKKAFKELKIFGGWVKGIGKELKIFTDFLNEAKAFRMPGLTSGFNLGGNRLNQREVVPLGSSHQSQSDVRITVSAEPGTTAQVDRVKSTGNSNLKVIAKSFLGSSLAQAH